MKIKTFLGVVAATAAMWLSASTLFAQNDNDGGRGGPPGGDFDPAQFRQRMMEQTRKNLNVTNDEEWSVIQPY